MTQQKIAVLLSTWNGKIPNECVPVVAENLKKVSDEDMPLLLAIPLKDTIIGLLLGLFLGTLGIDRFYKGDTGLGITKLVLTLTCVGLFITVFWALIDLFLVWKGIKEDNYQKIQLVLGNCNAEV